MGGSGFGFEGDCVAEGFELTDVIAFGPFGAHPCVADPGAEVNELGFGVGQQVPENGQDESANGDYGFLLPAPSGDASVAFTQKRVGLAGGHGRLAEDPGEVGVAVAGGSGALLAAGGFLDTRGEPGVGGQMSRGRDLVLSIPISAMTAWASAVPTRISSRRPPHQRKERSRLDFGVKVRDVGAGLVDAGESWVSRKPWWSVKCPTNASSSLGS